MNPIKRFWLLLLLTLTWSSSFLFIKLALIDFSPITIGFLRVFLAGGLFLICLKYSKSVLPKSFHFWKHSFFMAIFSSALPFFLFCVAETTIDSALAAILNGTTPCFTALLAFVTLSEKLSFNRVLGVFISMAGVILLFSPQLDLNLQNSYLGMVAALFGALSYAASHIYAKKFTSGYDKFVAPTAQMFMASCLLFPFMLFSKNSLELFMLPSMASILGILGMTFLGTFAGFILYYYLIERSEPVDISMVSCLFPVVGLILGVLFLNEEIDLVKVIAAFSIVLGMLMVNQILSLPKKKDVVDRNV